MQNAEDYSVLGSKLKIHSRYTFKDKVPPELLLSFYTPFKNLYLIILYKNEDYPTFRCSTRFNRGLNILGCEINVFFVFKKISSGVLGCTFPALFDVWKK
jgi:hypothetical protein